MSIIRKKGVLAWAFYDWANSAFATTVMAGFFPVFFKEYWAAGDAAISTYYLGLANSAASILIAVFAPFLGAIADRGSYKKKFLFIYCYIGSLSSGALWFVSQGNWPLAAGLYVLGAIGFAGGNIFYDSLLPSVSPPDRIDQVSSLGFSLGYIGGGLLFLINVMMYLKPQWFHLPDGTSAIKLSFVTVALWWGLFALPTFFKVKEDKKNSGITIFAAVKGGMSQLINTFKDLRKYKTAGLFLLAYWFYIDGVDTVIKMAVDFGISIGFPSSSLIVALLIVQFVAFPAALLYGLLARKAGARKALFIAIGAYIVLTCAGVFMQEVWHFYALAVGIGLFQGGIQALSRSYFARLVPKNKEGEFFGFFNMLGKFATVIGPLLVGVVTRLTHSNRLGILSIVILFLIGGVLFFFVRAEEKHA